MLKGKTVEAQSWLFDKWNNIFHGYKNVKRIYYTCSKLHLNFRERFADTAVLFFRYCNKSVFSVEDKEKNILTAFRNYFFFLRLQELNWFTSPTSSTLLRMSSVIETSAKLPVLFIFLNILILSSPSWTAKRIMLPDY